MSVRKRQRPHDSVSAALLLTDLAFVLVIDPLSRLEAPRSDGEDDEAVLDHLNMRGSVCAEMTGMLAERSRPQLHLQLPTPRRKTENWELGVGSWELTPTCINDARWRSWHGMASAAADDPATAASRCRRDLYKSKSSACAPIARQPDPEGRRRRPRRGAEGVTSRCRCRFNCGLHRVTDRDHRLREARAVLSGAVTTSRPASRPEEPVLYDSRDLVTTACASG